MLISCVFIINFSTCKAGKLSCMGETTHPSSKSILQLRTDYGALNVFCSAVSLGRCLGQYHYVLIDSD